MLKSTYVDLVRLLRRGADRAGLLRLLERSGTHSAGARWLRSLFAIYDIQDMAALDLPWWTFAAIREADEFLKSRPDARVFEYGSGASTIWLARRSGSVISIEHDRDWHGVVSQQLCSFPNATLRLIEPDPEPQAGYLSEKGNWAGRSFREYVSAIDQEPGQFDLIVIDGRARSACLRHSSNRLAPGGVIVFDNSNRARYRSAINASGLSARRVRGLAACLPYPDETSMLRRAVH